MFFFSLSPFFIYLFIFGNKQQDITSLSQYLIIIQSDRDLCPLTKLMITIEYTCMYGQKQSREDPDETVHMHKLILTVVIRMQ